MYDEFLNNKNVIIDVLAETKVKEMNLYCQQLSDEIKRLESRVTALHTQEQELIAMEQKCQALEAKHAVTLEQDKAIKLQITEAEGQLASLTNQIEQKAKELAMYTDLSAEIVELQCEKQDILAFIEANSISKDEVRLVTDQLNLLRKAVTEMEGRKTALNKEIIQKEAQARTLERDMELPNKTLAEAKQLKLEADSLFEQIRIEKEKEANQPGTIGAYVTLLKKKYPHIDFLNVV